MKLDILLTLILAVGLTAVNGQEASKKFHEWAETPPMGWNSYDCFGAAVNEEEVKGNAQMMAAHLKSSGWEYIVIDYCWYFPFVGALNNPPQTDEYKPSLPMDKYGRLQPVVDRFPSADQGKGFKDLADYIHSLGLKFGIHVMRGIPREAVARKILVKGTAYTADQIADTSSICRWLNTMYGIDMTKAGAQEYYNSIFEMYAEWGVDYVKVDDITTPYHPEEIEAIRKAIDKTGRPIVLSLSPGDENASARAPFLKQHANMWRISADFWDDWTELKEQFELIHTWETHIGKGHWPDADMIPIGLLNRRGPGHGVERRSNLNETEKYALMTLWSICRSPLMYGGDLMMMRPIELKLLANKEVMQVNQHSANNRQFYRTDHEVAWIADVPETGDRYLAVFNLGEKEISNISIQLSDLGFDKEVEIRDLWNKKELGKFKNVFSPAIKAHGSGLYLIRK